MSEWLNFAEIIWYSKQLRGVWVDNIGSHIRSSAFSWRTEFSSFSKNYICWLICLWIWPLLHTGWWQSNRVKIQKNFKLITCHNDNEVDFWHVQLNEPYKLRTWCCRICGGFLKWANENVTNVLNVKNNISSSL